MFDHPQLRDKVKGRDNEIKQLVQEHKTELRQMRTRHKEEALAFGEKSKKDTAKSYADQLSYYKDKSLRLEQEVSHVEIS